MNRIISSLLTIGILSAVIIGGTMSFFSDTETSVNNTFTAGTIDIAVDGENPWQKTFDWEDIKPGKEFEMSFNITNVGENPLKLWKIIKCVQYDDNGIIEPEQDWYDENPGVSPKNDLDSAIVYEMEVGGQMVISREAGITMDQIKDNYIGLMKLDIGLASPQYGILEVGESVSVVQKYFMKEDTENWAQSDKMTFVIEIEARQVSGPEPLQQIMFMENKSGSAVMDEKIGILKYDYIAPEFNYNFFATGLVDDIYQLIYYPDPWSGSKEVVLIGDPIVSVDGKIDAGDQSANLGMDLPNSTPGFDANYPYGAKVWLVPTSNLSGTTLSYSNSFLFENWPGLINYKQGTRPSGEINCEYDDEYDNPNCTDNDGDGYFVEASGCEDEPEFIGHSDCMDANPASWRVGTYYYDGDDDEYYGDGANRRDDGMMNVCCGDEIPAGYTETTLGRDCDDNNPLANPGVSEDCDNGLDDDCDGFVDCTDGDCIGNAICDGVTVNTITLNDLGADPQYGYLHNYAGASVNFTYINPSPVSGKLTGSMVALGLKPYATYQVKLEGKPTCATGGINDLANEYVGYNGRWTCVSGTTCVGDANAKNRTDAQYEANKALPGTDPNKECTVGYLVFDYFTADASGTIYADDVILSSNSSYHVLYCGTLYQECSTSTSNDYLQNLDPTHPSVLFCPEYRSSGQPEPGRGGCNNLSLTAGNYDLKMVLTEESFHQGNWSTVMGADISFVIN